MKDLWQGIYDIKCKDSHCFLQYETVKDNSIKYKCLYYKKDYSKSFDEELKKLFQSTFKFSNNDVKNCGI